MLVHVGSFRGIFAVCCGYVVLLSLIVSQQLEVCTVLMVHVPNFGVFLGSEDRGWDDNSIQFINFGRVSDKSFKQWRQKIGGWKGG